MAKPKAAKRKAVKPNPAKPKVAKPNAPKPRVAKANAVKRENAVLAELSAICLSLPETARRDMNGHADFRVRGKVYAYFLNNHHGDEIVSVCCKSELGENVDRASREPNRFYLPAYIGPRGWFGLRLDRGAIDWSEVRNLVELSYALAAPKSLLKKIT